MALGYEVFFRVPVVASLLLGHEREILFNVLSLNAEKLLEGFLRLRRLPCRHEYLRLLSRGYRHVVVVLSEPRLLPGDALVYVAQCVAALAECRLREREIAQGLVIFLFCLQSWQHCFHQEVSLRVPPCHVEDESLVLQCRHVCLPHYGRGAWSRPRRHFVKQLERVVRFPHAAQRRSHVDGLLGVVARQLAEDGNHLSVFASEQVEVGHVEHDVVAAWRRRPHHSQLFLIVAEGLSVFAKLLMGIGKAAVEQLPAVSE